MPRRTSATLTDAEARLMHVLWDHGAATVAEVVDLVPGTPRPAYNTVLTLLRILERKGYVTHAKAGRAFIYSPQIPRAQAQRRALAHLRSRLFGDSTTSLVQNLLSDEHLDARELDELKRMIRKA
jgi:predicted transcriptional regulator